MRPDLGRVQVYGLDFASGALGALGVLPHVGSVVDGADVERIQRLLRTLDGEMDRRAAAFSAASAASSRSTGSSGSADAAHPAPDRQLPRVQEGLGDRRPVAEPFYRTFMRILGEGRTLGLHTVITADRGNAVPTAVAANISRRVVLRMGDPSQYMLLGAPRGRARRALRARARSRRRARGADRGPGRHDNVAEQTKALDSCSAIGCARRASATCRRSAPFRRMVAGGRDAGAGRRDAGLRRRRRHARAAWLRARSAPS